MFQYLSLFFVISMFKVNGLKLLNDRNQFEDISRLLPKYYSDLSMDLDEQTGVDSKFIEIFKQFELETTFKWAGIFNYGEDDFVEDNSQTILDKITVIKTIEDAQVFFTLLEKVILPGTWTYYAFNHHSLFNKVFTFLNDLSIRTDTVDIFKKSFIFKLYDNLKPKSISKNDFKNKSLPTLIENIFETEILKFEIDQFGQKFENSICSEFTSKEIEDFISDFKKYSTEILKITKYSKEENTLENRVYDNFYPNHPDFEFVNKFELYRSEVYPIYPAFCSIYKSLRFDFDSQFTEAVKRIFMDGPFSCDPAATIDTVYPNPKIKFESKKDADLSLNCVFGKILALRKMTLRVNEILNTFEEEFEAYYWRFPSFKKTIQEAQANLGEAFLLGIDIQNKFQFF